MQLAKDKSEIENFHKRNVFDLSFGPGEINVDGTYTTDSYDDSSGFLSLKISPTSSTDVSTTIFRPKCGSKETIVSQQLHNFLCNKGIYISPYQWQFQIPVVRRQFLSLTYGSTLGNCYSSYSNQLTGIFRMYKGPDINVDIIKRRWDLNTTLTLYEGRTYLVDNIIAAFAETPKYTFISQNINGNSSNVYYKWITYDLEKYKYYVDKSRPKVKFYNTFPNYTSWRNADLMCRMKNMTLITLHSLEDNLAVPYVMSSLPKESKLMDTRRPFLIYVGLERKVIQKGSV